MSEEQTLREAYKIRDIPTRQLPAEFRFITYIRAVFCRAPRADEEI
jgi:hypothetical protein